MESVSDPKNGESIYNGGARFCTKHHAHGFLYVCENYDQELQEEIKRLGEKFRDDCLSGEILIIKAKYIDGQLIQKEIRWKDITEDF